MSGTCDGRWTDGCRRMSKLMSCLVRACASDNLCDWQHVIILPCKTSCQTRDTTSRGIRTVSIASYLSKSYVANSTPRLSLRVRRYTAGTGLFWRSFGFLCCGHTRNLAIPHSSMLTQTSGFSIVLGHPVIPEMSFSHWFKRIIHISLIKESYIKVYVMTTSDDTFT